MTVVRAATLADLDAMIDMGRALHAESPRYQAMEFKPAKLRELFDQLQGTLLVPAGCAFVAERDGHTIGMTVGMIATRWFSDARYLTDLTMYVKPEHRAGRAFVMLVRKLEAFAAQHQLDGPVLGVSTEIHAEQTVRAYGKLGYRLAGYVMVKDDHGH